MDRKRPRSTSLPPLRLKVTGMVYVRKIVGRGGTLLNSHVMKSVEADLVQIKTKTS